MQHSRVDGGGGGSIVTCREASQLNKECHCKDLIASPPSAHTRYTSTAMAEITQASFHSQTHCLSKDGSIGHRTAYTANTDRMGRLKLPSTLLKVGEREWLTNPTATTLPTCDLSLLYAGPSHRSKVLQQGTVGEGRTAYEQER